MNRKVCARLVLMALVLIPTASAWAQAAQAFGSIEYVEGNSIVMRSGKSLGEANIGDDVLPDDMIKTAADGLVVIALDKSTGMRGTLTINSKSVAYLRISRDQGGVKSGIELIAGQIASKMTKLSGNPTFQVSTESVAMGVRGTAFQVATSVNGSILITCSEGEVAATDGVTSLGVPAGSAVERKPAGRLRLIPVAVSSPDQFAKRWIADEIEAFKVNASGALADYEQRYTELAARFAEAFDPLQKSEILSKWIKEDSAGLVPNSNDPATLREKKDMAPRILEIRKVLFIFERIYYRIDQLEPLILGTALERIELRRGYTAGDFLRRFKGEASALERRVALFRYAERLYELRNQGGAGFSGLGNDDDFFGSSGDWDF